MEAHGTRGGEPFSCSITDASVGGVSRITVGTERWALVCDNQASQMSLQLEFPVQTPGAVNLTAGASGFNFALTAYDPAQSAQTGSMTESSTNLVSASLTGTIDSSQVGTGTFTASWSTPDSTCTSGDLNYPCAEGSVTMTFHVPLPN